MMKYIAPLLLLYATACDSVGKPNANIEVKEKHENIVIETINYEHLFGNNRPFPQCHASTMIATNNGNYLFAWFAGKHEKNDDVAIWMAHGRPGNWSAPSMVAKVNNEPHWNPVLFEAGGRIFLFFKVGKEIDDWLTYIQTSGDNGKTWSKAEQLVPDGKGGRGPVRNQPIVLSDGSWLAPASVEKNKVWNAFTDKSTDKGNTWSASDTLSIDRSVIAGEGVIQPALWESHKGKVHMLLRSSAGAICRSDSEDGGKTWSPVYKTSLPNNNSGIDVAQISGDTIAVIYNPVDENWGDRFPITVSVSTDNGKTWSYHFDIEKGEGDTELSYPDLMYKDGTLVACYTWNRQSIAFWKGKIRFH